MVLLSQKGSIHLTMLLALAHPSLIALFTIFFRLSPLHSLSAYPGPIQCKVSKLHSAWVASTGRQHVYYRSLHEKYGDIVRVGPNSLSIRHVGVISPMLGYGGLPKGPFWDHRTTGGEDSQPPLIAVRDPQEHSQRRRHWSRALSRTALSGYEFFIARSIESLTVALRARLDAPLDLTEWMKFFALENMGNMVFGQPYGILDHGVDNRGIHSILEEGIRFTAIAGQVSWVIPFLRLVYGRAYARMKQYARSSAMERLGLDEPDRPKDLFYYLNDEGGSQRVKRPVALVASDASMAMVAGSDTTSATLTGLWYYLLTNDIAYKRLQKEIDAVVAEDIPNTSSRVLEPSNMPYLNACMSVHYRTKQCNN
ncbi:hypothetical protein ONZ45_g10130 [Pleurotus djamor]|nr:hypothetical protein ONZ45_g10130 [Pleurotus djamor]